MVKAIRYHESKKEVDHWTELTNDLSSFTNSVQGLGLTYGYELQAGRISNKNGVYFLLVCYVVKDSPAEKALVEVGLQPARALKNRSYIGCDFRL